MNRIQIISIYKIMNASCSNNIDSIEFLKSDIHVDMIRIRKSLNHDIRCISRVQQMTAKFNCTVFLQRMNS